MVTNWLLMMLGIGCLYLALGICMDRLLGRALERRGAAVTVSDKGGGLE